jgi:cytochrome b pre-mRNA-processing protein 3
MLFAKKAPVQKPDMNLLVRLYSAQTALSRAKVFYARLGVPDTTDGRYDMFCLTLALFLFRVQQMDQAVAQALFDLAFNDQERGLREAGVGDLSVSKHMKKMLEAFYGRASLYYEALEQNDTGSLSAVLTRNLYNGDLNAPSGSMAEWVRIAWMYLSQVDKEEFFAEPEQILQLLPNDVTEEAAV